MATTSRYYLHGDESEDSPGSYFCKKCDVFLPEAHFSTPCGDVAHQAIYDRHYQSMLGAISNVRRPLDPPGIAHLF